MISDSNKCIFIHIPKTGGSSVNYFLKDIANENVKIATSRLGKGKGVSVQDSKGKNVKHLNIEEVLAIDPEKYNDYYKFTVARNPYDRTMSYFFWHRGNKKKGFVREEFKDFVKKLNEFQVSYITDSITGEILVDKIVKYEQMSSGLNSIQCLKKFNFSNLPYLNVSQNKGSFYDKELKELVYQKFKRDFEVLGYPK